MDLLWQRIYISYMGAAFAGSLGDLPPEMFLAICDTDLAAFEAWSNTNNARSEALRERRERAGVQTTSLF